MGKGRVRQQQERPSLTVREERQLMIFVADYARQRSGSRLWLMWERVQTMRLMRPLKVRPTQRRPPGPGCVLVGKFDPFSRWCV
jgi:hypothetical protein